MALSQYVGVLDQRAQQSMVVTGQAQAQLARTQVQLQRLKSMAEDAGLKKLHGNVALYANAAVFRSGLLDMVEQCRDACGVQQLEYAQAQARMHVAMRKHGSMDSVLHRVRTDMELQAKRQEQKSMDELAGQAWHRQHQNP